MPVHFIDNYPKSDLESKICKQDKTPLYGELWVYQELLKFNENGFLKDETWYVKHNYNLSSHPSSGGKVEGQVDFIVLSKYGTLIIEVKGGGIEVDADDTYYCYDKKDRARRYETQNPFNQAKEYVHSLKALLNTNTFIYRAVIFPHEANFELKGPQLAGYTYLFFSRRHLDAKDSEYGKNELFFNFLTGLAKLARKNIISQLSPPIDHSQLDSRIWLRFPSLSKKEIDRLKSELFPVQNTYGFDPDRIKHELLLEENYEILKGLRRNRKIMVQGGPGTGKTVLATKFLAENLLKQQKGIFFCANKLLRAKMEYLMIEEYRLDPNSISFKIYHEDIGARAIKQAIDFVIFDEAQEFFDKGLYELIENIEVMQESPKVMILYDPDQAIVQNFKDIDWYADFLIDSVFVHYHFDNNWRCTQNRDISDFASLLRNSHYKKALRDFDRLFLLADDLVKKLKAIKSLIDTSIKEPARSIILVNSSIIKEFQEISGDYFKNELEELTENNVNIKSQKIRFTTPLKYKGLEANHVVLITPGLSDLTRIENYVAVTRAVYNLTCILWM